MKLVGCLHIQEHMLMMVKVEKRHYTVKYRSQNLSRRTDVNLAERAFGEASHTPGRQNAVSSDLKSCIQDYEANRTDHIRAQVTYSTARTGPAAMLSLCGH